MMRVALVWVRPDGKQQEIPLRKAVHVIGRATDCQIRVPSSSISRHHCEVVVGDDDAVVRDLGSSNGTFVNRKKVSQTVLAAGDLICLGELVFVAKLNGTPGEIDAEDAYDDGHVTAPVAAAKAMKPEPKPTGKKPAASLEDSSITDFDFLSEDDDMKKQPKL
jgi:predicted component of type VI protein secretion system